MYMKSILQISVEVGMTPETMFKFVNGQEIELSIIPLLLYFGPNALIITSTDDLYIVMLVSKQPANVALFTLIFDSERQPVFPDSNIFHGNLINILQCSHIEKDEIFLEKNMTRLYLYYENFSLMNQELICDGASLNSVLQNIFWKPPERTKFLVNGRTISYIDYQNLVNTVDCSKAVNYGYESFKLVEYGFKPG
jgi:hypothetical protein